MGIVLAVAAAVTAVIAALSALGKLPRNRTAGVRLASTLRSDDAWERGHRAAAPLLGACAAVMVVGAVDAPLRPWLAPAVVIVLIGAALLADRAAERGPGASTSGPATPTADVVRPRPGYHPPSPEPTIDSITDNWRTRQAPK